MKFKTEKALHEVIRDLPGAMQLEIACENGMITPFEALREIVRLWNYELDKVATEINENWNEVI